MVRRTGAPRKQRAERATLEPSARSLTRAVGRCETPAVPNRWRLFVLVPLAWACARVAAHALPASSPPPAPAAPTEGEPKSALVDSASMSTVGITSPKPSCPTDMALIHGPEGAYCIDRYEA